jgi:hypothetical protein
VFGQAGNKAGLDLTGVNSKIDRRIEAALKPAIDPAAAQRIRDMHAAGVPTYRIRREGHFGWNTIQTVLEGEAAPEPAPDWLKPLDSRWQARDVRRTVRTLFSKVGILRDIAERMLGHLVGNKVERTYDRHDFWAEKRDASNRLESSILSIVNGTAADEKVVRGLKFGRRA